MDHPTSRSAGESSDFFYGWDLLYRTVEDMISKKADVLVVLAHFLLTKHCKFRCIGIEDERTVSEDESGSELLPDRWNEDTTKYSLRYVHGKVYYLFLAHITEDALIINLLDVSTKNVSNLCVTPETLVQSLKGGISQTMPTALSIIERFRRELCEPVFAVKAREATTQPQTSESPTQSPDPLLVEEHRRPGAYMPYGFEASASSSYPDVGRGDLDPLAAGMGNLYQLPRNPGPVRPNIPGQNNPNPDHAQPPDWNPDQYM